MINNIALAKFIETGFRSLFVIFCTFGLSLSETALFGLLITYSGIASLIFGYERYIDIQRQNVNSEPGQFDKAVLSAVIFFLVNYLLVTPIYIFIIIITLGLEPWLVLLCIFAAIGDQICNFVYQMAMVNQRYKSLLYLTAIKNVLMVIGLIFIYTSEVFTFQNVISLWSILTIATTALILLIWVSFNKVDYKSFTINRNLFKGQYQISIIHFLLGLFALLNMQIGRLTVGGFLSLDLAGTYFRHALIMSLVYQVFNIASYNRILPIVFSKIADLGIDNIKKIAIKEHYKVIILLSIMIFIIFGIYTTDSTGLFKRFSLDPYFLTGLIIATIIKTRADLESLILHGSFKENIILNLQLLTLIISVLFTIFFTVLFGILGTILASIVSALVYLIFIEYSLYKVK